MKRELSRDEILSGNYKYPKGFIKLIPTNHCMDRLSERGQDLDFLPSLVKITENNICSGRTKDNKKLNSVVIRMEYTGKKDLYLCFNPFDAALKTVWYGSKKKQPGKKNTG